jgi:predicted transcriptional regulator of viral defense system
MLAKAQPKIEALKDLSKRRGIITPRDLDELGIPRNYLGRLVHQGVLRKLQRGLYAPSDAAISEHQSLIEVSQKIPRGVICLLSALRYHQITTQSPHEVWVALGIKAWAPKPSYPLIRVVRLSPKVLEYGVEEHRILRQQVRVFSAAKTVADCFKFRNKIGIDIALEALRDAYRQKKASTDEIWAAAKICRVTNVMRPYLETL